MLKKIEKIADKIVDYFEKDKDKTCFDENKNKVYYKIFPYYDNSFNTKTFLNFLNIFSYYENRIDFYVSGNANSLDILIAFDNIIENKFYNKFYEYFPKSKLQKISFELHSVNKYIYCDGLDNLKPKNKNDKDIFLNICSLISEVPKNKSGTVKYSLIFNSQFDSKDYDNLISFFVQGIKSLLYFLYRCLFYITSGKKLKKIKKNNNIKKGTTMSIGVCGDDSFSNKIYDELQKNLTSNLLIKDEEFFSCIEKMDFTYFFNIPNKKDDIKGIEYIKHKRLPLPQNLDKINNDMTFLGTADWNNDNIDVGILQQDKARHVYIIGKTGVGKSTLLSNMALSDLEKGRGLALIDPHGDLVENILQFIPENRQDDIVLFDVSNTQNIVGFNVFENTKNKDLTVSTILSIFKKLYGYSWGPRLEYILRNVLLTLIEYDKANFLHIIKILTDKDFRKKVLIQVTDPIINNFWNNEFSKRSERFASEAISPITNKVGQFTSSSIIRNIFGQNKSTISIEDIMNNNKILLVNLSKGLIGEDNSSMIGAFIVSQIQLETMKKANISLLDRKNFSLYIDEFQNFVTDSFANILSEARKYNLSLVLANQYISQINQTVQNSIFGNVGNMICFNSGNEDAEILSKHFKNQVGVNDILSIPKFKAYVKIMIEGSSTDVFGLNTYPVSNDKFKNNEFVENLVTKSNEKYTKPKEKVEENINEIISSKNFINEKINKQKINNEKTKKDIGKTNLKDNDLKVKQTNVKKQISSDNPLIGNIFDGIVKLKFNYGLFVLANGYEGLLHKKNINLPEGIFWKNYFSIGDKIRVKLKDIKEVDGQTKAVWEHV